MGSLKRKFRIVWITTFHIWPVQIARTVTAGHNATGTCSRTHTQGKCGLTSCRVTLLLLWIGIYVQVVLVFVYIYIYTCTYIYIYTYSGWYIWKCGITYWCVYELLFLYIKNMWITVNSGIIKTKIPSWRLHEPLRLDSMRGRMHL